MIRTTVAERVDTLEIVGVKSGRGMVFRANTTNLVYLVLWMVMDEGFRILCDNSKR